MTDIEKHGQSPWHKYPDRESALEQIRKADLAYFLGRPGLTEYLRDIIPGEFEEGDRAEINYGDHLPEPSAGYKWMVAVSALRDPIDGRAIMQVREAFLVPK
jgi:hypothetical protein